jgi:hypothetical protein
MQAMANQNNNIFKSSSGSRNLIEIPDLRQRPEIEIRSPLLLGPGSTYNCWQLCFTNGLGGAFCLSFGGELADLTETYSSWVE